MTTGLARYRPTELDTETLGGILVKSGFFQDTKDAAQAIVKVLAGRELGFGPIASMQGVYIVKGRVTLSANLVGAAIQRSNKYRYTLVELTNERCRLVFRGPDGATFDSEFTIDDAKKAGLVGDTYNKFPRNMLFARALTNGARWFCPEVFNGPIYTPDELGADVDDDGNVVDIETGEVRIQGPVHVAIKDQAPEDDRDMVRSADESIWQNWLKVLSEAQGLGLNPQQVTLPVDRRDLKEHGNQVIADIRQREKMVATVGVK